MEINVNTKAICTIDIDSAEAFRILCETLYMSFVLDEDTDYFVYKNSDDELNVFKTGDGHVLSKQYEKEEFDKFLEETGYDEKSE